MVIENNCLLKYLSLECETREVLLSEIKLDPQDRDRNNIRNYMKDARYGAMGMTMDQLGQLENIILRKIGNELFLISGFLRFLQATDLGWKKIEAKIYSNITDYQARIIRAVENIVRINLSSYDTIMTIGELKEIWEKEFPHTKRGKYIRSQKNIIIPDSGNMVSNNKNSVPSFVKAHYGIFGISKSTLYNKTRIYDAIINEVLDKKSINLFMENKIKEDAILKKLHEIERRQKSDISRSISSKNIEIPPNMTSHINSQNKNKRQCSTPFLENDITEFTDEQVDDVEFLRESVINRSKESDRDIVNKVIKVELSHIKENKGEPILEKDQKDICLNCPKALVHAIKCENCGHLTRRVICDNDIIRGDIKLRNPFLKRCESS